MTFETLVKYTEEGIKCSKELQKFLHAKSHLDIEYSQKMVNTLAMAQQKQTKEKDVPQERLSLMKTSLWTSFEELIQQLQDGAETMRTVASNIDGEIAVPMLSLIKEIETARKTVTDEGVKQTNILQENYVALKKAKQQLDDNVAMLSEAKDAFVKAQRSPNIKEKELDKLNQRVTQLTEKVLSSEDNFKQIDESCKSAQLRFFSQTMPEILQQLYSKEEERCVMTHSVLRNWSYMEKQFSEYKNKASDWMQDKIEGADVTGDLEDLFTEHMNAGIADNDDPAKGGSIPSISVRSLINPIKAGRILKKADENDVSWKPRYFVLMGDRQEPDSPLYQSASGRLYYFESEDALKPKGVIDLSVASVYSVDDSLFPGKQNLFLISTTITTTEDNFLVTKHKTYYLSAESPDEHDRWLNCLKRYALCCMPCVSVSLGEPISLNLDNTETVVANFPKASEKEVGYRTVKSLRLWIMEARDLGALETANNQNDIFFGYGSQKTISPFCSISTNEVRIGKTTTKSVTSPFWGEEIYFDELAECEQEFKITVHTQIKRREEDLGYCEIKVSQLREINSENCVQKKFEAWIPIIPFGSIKEAEEGEKKPAPAIRIQAILSDECILPLYEYPVFVNCLFSDDFKILKTIARSAEKCTSFARDDFARSLISILCATETDITAFRALLTVDVEGTDDPNIIFRGNSLATKAIDQYMKFIGSEYLKNTLSGPIKLVYEKASRQESCEVDATRLDRTDDELLKKHQKRLLAWVQLFWDAIQNSIEKCPRNLRETLQSIREMVLASFMSRNKDVVSSVVQYSAVSGFIFLRFFCPAILNPKLFGLWPEISENPVATRTLTLIAKVLQNLANLSDFKGKEPHMEFCNQWIFFNMDAMKSCIIHFSTAPPAAPEEQKNKKHRYAFLFDDSMNIDLSREFNFLFLHIQNNYQDLKQVYEELKKGAVQDDRRKIDPNALATLFHTIETMQIMYARYDHDFKTQKERLANCAHLQKQFTLIGFASTLGSQLLKDEKAKKARKETIKNKLISQPTLIGSSNTDIGNGVTEDEPEVKVQAKFSKRASRMNFDDMEVGDYGTSRRGSKKSPDAPTFNLDTIDLKRNLKDVPSPLLPLRKASMDFGKAIEDELTRKLSEADISSPSVPQTPLIPPRNLSHSRTLSPSNNRLSTISLSAHEDPGVGKKLKRWFSGSQREEEEAPQAQDNKK